MYYIKVVLIKVLKTLKLFLLLLNVRGSKTIVKLRKWNESFVSYLELGGWGNKTFWRIILGHQNFLPDGSGAQKLFYPFKNLLRLITRY